MRDVGEEVGRYASAVREALAHAPAADRELLLEDLEQHLAEVAAESASSLSERLGPPAAYAAELWTAYSGRAPRRRFPSRRWMVAVGGLVVAAALVGGGMVWRSAQSGPSAHPWSYSQLMQEAQAGDVRSVTITGGTGIARTRDGTQHTVQLPADRTDAAHQLSQAGVNVSFQPAPGGLFGLPVNTHPVFYLVFLAFMGTVLLVVGGLVTVLVFGIRAAVRRAPPSGG